MVAVHWPEQLDFRTVFISDTHLGFRGARADLLLSFLEQVRCRELYLVGDIFDIWEMQRRGIYWPAAHNAVLRHIFELARQGTRVVYVPGNHDEMLRQYAGSIIEYFEIHRRTVHETADGRRLLVLHGDEFDAVVQCSRLIAMLGSRAYDWLLWANTWVNAIRRRLGFPYWSLAGHLKHRVKNAVNYISDFEVAVAREARRHDLDGVVCGHIHHAEIRPIDGVLYCNDGDWVESCTALVEDHNGRLSILPWASWRADGLSASAVATGRAA
ncbi:UDP-2,3-diacylglucosamine diphosphatase [Arhodomonas sp. AD133]|uniref:UDP-2,3-diacylglucosamine diphosphatase n=1 Tax=Arhodomonas sp. AD133 TaxID=3415009 RepID=UPI003EB9DDEA